MDKKSILIGFAACAAMVGLGGAILTAWAWDFEETLRN